MRTVLPCSAPWERGGWGVAQVPLDLSLSSLRWWGPWTCHPGGRWSDRNPVGTRGRGRRTLRFGVGIVIFHQFASDLVGGQCQSQSVPLAHDTEKEKASWQLIPPQHKPRWSGIHRPFFFA